jgi:4-alpha-glucanotransferase
MALKRRHEELARAEGRVAGSWNDAWDRATALRDPSALARWRHVLRQEIAEEETIQFFFFSQWRSLRAAAANRGISIIGDLPIFVAPDSADVWAQRDFFLLDAEGHPRAVSGVPPDYFAATGQLWGNPLYDWDALARDGYRFWIRRITASLRLFDMVRIDHFRGFEACWTVPYGETTAEHGEWVKIPGRALFDELRRVVGDAPIIAEDLGVITPAVNALREELRFPGMRILQFAFDQAEAGVLSAENRFLPHNHTVDSVVYTGTHDNDTSRGWWATRTADERAYLERYVGPTDPDIEWRLIRLALASVCRYAVIPLQDVLGLGSETRMNTPGTRTALNWTWRFDEKLLTNEKASRLRELSRLYGRTD